MNVLVSLCNRSAERYKDLREKFLLRIDTATGGIEDVPLPHEWIVHAWGMTGISRRDRGYVCVLPPSSVLYLSDEFQAESIHPLSMVRDAHSVVYHEGKSFIVSTGTDSIIEFSPETGERIFWRANDGGEDTIHLNSLLWDDAGCWITAFGPKAGPLWNSADQGYVLNVQTSERLLANLFHPHSIVKAQGVYYVCESSRMKVRNTRNGEIVVPRGYLRGLAVEGGYMIVGSTKGRKKSKSTGALIDNAADPGEPAGGVGLAIYRMNEPLRDPEFESFIDLSEYADEIYDVIVLPGDSPILKA